MNATKSTEINDLKSICLDCGVDTGEIREYYMIKPEVWYSVAEKGQLCLTCLERRLCRSLMTKDFILAPVNTDPEVSRSHKLNKLVEPILAKSRIESYLARYEQIAKTL